MSYSKVINILDLSLSLSWKLYRDEEVVEGKDLEELKKYLYSLTSYKTHVIFDYNLSRDMLLFKGDLEFDNILRNGVHRDKVHYCTFGNNIEFRNLKSLIDLPTEEIMKIFKTDDEIESYRLAIKEELSNCRDNSYRYLPKTVSGWITKRLKNLYGENWDIKNFYKELQLNAETQPIYTSLKKYGLMGYTPGTAGILYKDCVYSYDIKSSYPYQMCNAEYPLTGGAVKEDLPIDKFEFYEQKGFLYCAKMELKDITLKPNAFDWLEHSEDGIYTLLKPEYEMLKDAYNFTLVRIPQIVIHLKKGKLPDKIINLIKTLFQEKEDSKGNIYLYQKKKKQVNSIFGLFCQVESLESTTRRPSIIGYWSIGWAKKELYNLAKISPKHVLYWDTDSIKTTKRLIDEIKLINSSRKDKMGIWVEEFAEVDFCCYGRKAYVIDNIPKIAGLPKTAIPSNIEFKGQPITFKSATKKIKNKKLIYNDYTLKI